MALRRLSLTRGDSDNFGVTFKQSDGTLYNIKNWTVFFTLKTDYDLPDSAASLQKIITTFDDTTSGTSGSANIPIVPSDTGSLEEREYDYDIKVCVAPGGENYTVDKGKLDLEYNVTKSTGTAGTA
uniref:Uncharacterized protein n=1 Tax=viral metagenome TaxID=1070528 RepID=A0A6M3LJL9_9ZZZZ